MIIVVIPNKSIFYKINKFYFCDVSWISNYKFRNDCEILVAKDCCLFINKNEKSLTNINIASQKIQFFLTKNQASRIEEWQRFF